MMTKRCWVSGLRARRGSVDHANGRQTQCWNPHCGRVVRARKVRLKTWDVEFRIPSHNVPDTPTSS